LTGDFNGGEFQPLLAWMHHHLQLPGHQFSAEDLIRKVIGSGLDASAFFHHVERNRQNL